jgi:hypothetical protein
MTGLCLVLSSAEEADGRQPPVLLQNSQENVQSPDEDQKPAHINGDSAVGATHRFFDGLNIGLTCLEGSALLFDGIVTQYIIKTYPGQGHEIDPIARPFVDAGWPGQIAGGLLFIGADVGLRYLLHRKNHHRWERLLPLVLTAYGGISTGINLSYLPEYRAHKLVLKRTTSARRHAR